MSVPRKVKKIYRKEFGSSKKVAKNWITLDDIMGLSLEMCRDVPLVGRLIKEKETRYDREGSPMLFVLPRNICQ